MTEQTTIDFFHPPYVHIETAIKLYEGGNFFCALTLAGAAEEYLGKHLEQQGKISEKKEIIKKLPEKKGKNSVDGLHHTKNFLKHGLINNTEDDIKVPTSPVDESRFFIVCAISNFIRCTGELPENFLRFFELNQPKAFSAEYREYIEQILFFISLNPARTSCEDKTKTKKESANA